MGRDSVGGGPVGDGVATIYLDLLKRCLTRSSSTEMYSEIGATGAVKRSVLGILRRLLTRKGLDVVRRSSIDVRLEGRDWPRDAETMIGLKRLDNLRDCVVDVLRQGVPGDLIETGAWRGGATIFMRGVLRVYGDTDRTVWVADSFQGLPKPDPERYPADRGVDLWHSSELSVPLEAVKANFAKYGLLDEQVRFLPGWFRDTLPVAPIDRLAVLRLDGDLYESTIVALRALYPKLSPGGYVIVDDYGAVPACRAAVEDYRSEHGISDEIREIDWTGVFWQRSS